MYLAPVFLLVISYVFGELYWLVTGKKEMGVTEKCIVGTFLLLLSFELGNLLSIKTQTSFESLCDIYSIFLLIVVLLAAILLSKDIYKHLYVSEPVDVLPSLAVLAVLLLQFACFFYLMPDLTSDYTLETINTTIESNLIYENHPGMGETFQYGITFRGKLVSLPIFYAYLSTLFTGEKASFLYRAIPIWTLLISYIVYGLWANILFKKENRKKVMIAMFLVGVGIINLSGMFSKNCIFYNQMFRGFRGETIIFTTILPYCVYCIFKLLEDRKNDRWLNIVLALAASVALADYQRGFLPCVISIIVCVLIYLTGKIWRWIKCRQ